MIEILMTIKDRQDYLQRQLEYFLPFLSSNLRLTVYDDGSDIPLFLTGDTPFTRLIRGDINVGLIEARNNLLAHSYASSKYVLFLDDDIFIYNFDKFLELALYSLTHDDSLLAVSCPYINLPTQKYGVISTFKKIYDTDKLDSDYVVYFFGGTSLFDKEKLVSLGGLEGKYRIYLEEEDLALRAFCKNMYFKVLYSNNFIAIHDQAPGKNSEERSVYLLSNRMLFHYKFIRSSFLRNFLNLTYVCLYLVKTRDFTIIHRSIARYKNNRSDFLRLNFDNGILLKFFKKRFF
jgi:GT2 family glycosyltransferase